MVTTKAREILENCAGRYNESLKRRKTLPVVFRQKPEAPGAIFLGLGSDIRAGQDRIEKCE